ncbi:flagellar motor switch protein FliN [bacterium]|nr:flagellar motor switch protein FliN [bacterium]MCP5463116.1 flagellar motor switch protein FliN [bacterium]
MADQLGQSDIDALLKNHDKKTSAPSTVSQPAVTGAQKNDIAVARPLSYSQLGESTFSGGSNNIDLILDVGVELTVELGRKNMLIKDILDIGAGSVIELNRLAGEPVDLLINNKLLARGEVVVVNENFGIRIIDIIGPEQRIKNLR